MKQAESKDRTSVMYIGKGVIIAAIIITASLSFTLGFFVGKSFRPSPVEQLSAAPRQDIILPQPVEPLKKDETVSPQPAPMEKPQIQATREPQPQPSPELKKTQLTQETVKAAKTRKYTVQVEAFKNTSTADALKEKLSKKGYKASVISVKTKKRENLFKVIVGEFTNRKEAEVMSVKLKKTENLQHAFVTFKSE